MKVLYLVSGIGPPAAWGTEYIQNLIFALSKKGVGATIINPIYKHTHPDWLKWSEQQEKKYSVRIISLTFPNLIKRSLTLHFLLTPFFTTLWAIKLMSKERYDIVHEFSSSPIILLRSLLFKIIFKTPTVFSLSVYNKSILGSLNWIKFFDFASLYLIPSQKLIGKLAALGLSKDKLVLSPPGLPLKPFLKKKNRASARKSLNLPQDKLVFTYFGPLSKEKGVGEIIEASKLIDRSCRHKILIVFYVIWKGSSEHNHYLKKIYSLRSSPIRVVEKYVDIPTLLSASDVVILPPRSGHGTTIPPISIIETLAAQVPLITTRVPAVTEWVKDKSGVVIPPGSAQALADAITAIFKRGAKFKKFKSPKIFLDQFSLKSSTQLHLSIYSSLWPK